MAFLWTEDVAWLLECLFSMEGAWVLATLLHKLGMVVQVCSS